MSLLRIFRRRRNLPQHTGAAPAPVAATATQAVEPPLPAPALPGSHRDLLRRVNALALNDARVADAALQPDAVQTVLLLSASSEIARIGIEPRYTPRQPSLLPQLLEAVNDEEASLRALARVVAQDPHLTGELLRTANSAMYRVSATPVESIERATALLGTQGIRTIIAAALVQPLAAGGEQQPGRFGDVIWEHSLYGASAAEAWAARTQDADPFAAHLVALLHGLGAVAVYRVLIDLQAAGATPPDTAMMGYALDTSAAVTAGRIASNWGLSARTREALEAQSSAAPVNGHQGLARALEFGLLAGAATLLCKHGLLEEQDAHARIDAAGFHTLHVDRIWDRMLRAYVRR